MILKPDTPSGFFLPMTGYPGLTITHQAEAQPLDEFLDDIFRGTNLSYYTEKGQVIITRDYEVIDKWSRKSLKQFYSTTTGIYKGIRVSTCWR